MHPDDDSQTTLSKWPFITGDILLVATALAIAILSGWQLTSWQVGACVVSVALGAALFVLPYVVEFQVRVREENEDRAADLRILEKHIRSAEQALDALDARTRALEAVVASADDPNAALAEVVDGKFAQLEVARASQEEVTNALRANLAKLSKKIPAAFDPKILKPIEDRLKVLEERPASPLEDAPASSVKKEEAPASPLDVDPSEKKKAPFLLAKKVAQIERPQRAPRERHGPEESRLLKRAISEKGDGSATAVSRIIEFKAKKDIATAEMPEIKEPEAKETEPEKIETSETQGLVVEAPDSAKSETAEPEVLEPANESPLTAEEVIPEKKAPVKGAPTVAQDSSPEPEPKENLTASTVTKKTESKKVKATVEAATEESSDMLFDDAKITSPVTRTKAKKNDAVITASVFIGIGNKPYLRGSAGGLSWEKGLAMEFQEIGKWRWVAPSDLDAALEVQIYRNDEDPDQSGKYTLEPSQKLEVTPVF